MADPHKPVFQASGELEFSIETTTMRLKSLKLRRTEAAEKALDDHLRTASREPTRTEPTEPARLRGPAGRVRHDERGMAVWDWAAATGETAALSATNVMRKLDVSGLSIEQSQCTLKALQPPAAVQADSGDPYNQHRNQVNADPLKRAVPSGDPYNRAGSSRAAPPVHRPAPKAAPAPKKSGSSVLDQLLGRKK